MENYSDSTPGTYDPGDKGSVIKEQVKQGTQQVAAQTQETASQLAGQAQQQATTALSTQKDRAAQTLTSTAEALRQTGQTLSDQNQSAVSQLANTAADQIEKASTYLSQHDVNQIVDEVEWFARRQTGLFLGGAFALGLLAARFLKSSSPSQGYEGSYGNRAYPHRSAAYPPVDTYGSTYGGTYGTSGGREGTAYSGSDYGSSGTISAAGSPSGYSSYTTGATDVEDIDTRAHEFSSGTDSGTTSSYGGSDLGIENDPVSLTGESGTERIDGSSK